MSPGCISCRERLPTKSWVWPSPILMAMACRTWWLRWESSNSVTVLLNTSNQRNHSLTVAAR